MNKPDVVSFRRNKVARRLVTYIVIFSSIVTLMLTAAQLYREYKYDLSLIEARFNEIAATHKESMEKNLWLLNTESMRLLLEGILRQQNIAYLEIVDNAGKKFIAKGVNVSGDFRQRIIPLNYFYRGEIHPLGQFKVVATLEYVYQRLLDSALIILITQALKTFLVTIFIVFIVWRLITRHLETIREYAESLDIEDAPENILLKRNENHWTQNDELSQVIYSLNQMSQKLRQSYRKIEHQSFHDHLTGLPNRRLLEDRLQHEMMQTERFDCYGAILFVDLDHFKLLNDSLGHSIGDELLCEISLRLLSVVRQGDTVARIGGDEFIILLCMLSADNAKANQEARQIGYKIQQQLNKQFHLKGHDYRVTSSIGITLFKGRDEEYGSILKHADNAMYQAKAAGRNAVKLYQSKMQEKVDLRLSTERKLNKAIENHEFVLFYQPKYNQQRKIVAAEVLIRWLTPEGELISPLTFIPVAEESGLIVPIGHQVLSMAFEQVAQERKNMELAGIQNISINISPRQFNEANLTEVIIHEIEKYDIEPDFFIFELTEDAMVRNIDKTIAKMKLLKNYGFNLSIDDFGTGYSSMRYLKDFPLDELKIDQSFVSNIEHRREDQAIVSSIISMARNLGLQVVAEGVETEQQLAILLNDGCQLFQGYLFSKPVPLTEFIRLYSNQIERPADDTVLTPLQNPGL
ncbi:MAG: EAL domain-containing protein [Gammaproteobacteria bacterium]|nr:EAL domain-containing protein [Gammaproteobacteria bacterium]